MMASLVLNGLSVAFGMFASTLSYIFSWVFALLHLLVTPLLYLLRGLLWIASLPLALIVKLEAFLYFVTGALLTGVTVGLFLYFSGNALTELLRLQSSQSFSPKESLNPKDEPIEWDSKWDNQLLSSTIPEEEENSSG
ncbi:hypothetical protein N7488_009024 [Penicillium malachiteum]|nr:hypothetical protein N7488_009024 [Penicillium malachiteum]